VLSGDGGAVATDAVGAVDTVGDDDEAVPRFLLTANATRITAAIRQARMIEMVFAELPVRRGGGGVGGAP
jgi:hypothetical protein